MMQRRTHRREDTLCMFHILDTETGALLGRAVDISATGIRIRSEKAFSPEETLRLLIAPVGSSDTEAGVRMSAKCVWTQEDEESGFFDSGLRFLSSTPGRVRELKEMMQSNGFDI